MFAHSAFGVSVFGLEKNLTGTRDSMTSFSLKSVDTSGTSAITLEIEHLQKDFQRDNKSKK
jgi:hypothetical protein